ncbi:MAG: hypothetical protein KKA62_02110 [Nanoarchaeota archaeon]|nr:hypothetical protein [Nanoarchaeota archaeon]MBU1644212.1 hypothetical protein [Nanoarchaeota archaeon]MBU1976729.1 hypothetical protein [Nanoarchaeota archaeon]
MAGSPFNRCVECDDIITNPLCSNCLAERMVATIRHHDVKLADAIKGFKVDGETKCILCGEGMGLCAHCFSMDIYRFLAERNTAAAEDFLSQFDFDLRKELI